MSHVHHTERTLSILQNSAYDLANLTAIAVMPAR